MLFALEMTVDFVTPEPDEVLSGECREVLGESAVGRPTRLLQFENSSNRR